ncbi:RagB/SusD family nutrient uptake outer membrane protein [Flavivirga amylovorans]|uniref:RagB/SusD family nutrient uptake outer membrane protein n=1 Tax=Flavivirga amylovorans TaxID=870486 RepID=A0ABT8X0Z2_9FLAO|nr:RagB/SusD family nutrient uptake outer membrane protein [Flavivirga amylovorans]MDO5987613.1 RagB/SusD family nutrient uptake outer membrane protein [Flavivirga amylovorans]
MKKYLYILCLTFLVFSCDREEYLDIQPKGQIIPNKVDDYRLLLDQTLDFGGISAGFVETFSGTEIASDDVMITDNLSDNYPEGTPDVNIYTWSDNIFTQDQEDEDWQLLYGQIYTANIVLEEILDATNGTLQEKLALKAEAQAHRAFAYFILVNLYGVHYNPASVTTDLGVPLRLGTELVGIEFPRATIEDVYNLILDDLNEALDNLPDTPEFVHRPSKAGVYSLLARVYLYMGEFQKAWEASNNALLLSNTLVDFNTHPDWFFPGVVNPGDLPEDDAEIIWHKASNNTFSFRIASNDFLSLIAPNDQRRRRFAGPFLFGLGGTESIYATGFARNFKEIGPSVPEMHLTRAECSARLGNLSEALNDLNTLREMRVDTGTFTPFASADQTEVLNWIKTERRLELIMKGHRFFDLKRYNVYDTPKTDLTHVFNGTTYTLNANSTNWAFPIAAKYILQSPEIGENIRE